MKESDTGSECHRDMNDYMSELKNDEENHDGEVDDIRRYPMCADNGDE